MPATDQNRVSCEGPTDLLESYRPTSFFLSSPRGPLLADAPLHRLASVDTASAALSRASENNVLFGALPFDGSQPPQLGLGAVVRLPAPLTVHQEIAAPVPIGADTSWAWEEPDDTLYKEAVRAVIKRIGQGEVDKVVLARAIDLTADRDIEVGDILRALVTAEPDAYSFAVDLGDRTLVGASPELLVSVHNGRATANPLAGSAPRHPDPVLDRIQATQLLESAKDQREHQVVVDAVADALAPLCRELETPARPALSRTRTMWHLSSRVTAVPREGVTALDLARALHPTPAVCGQPTGAARQAIRELEASPRGFYSGMVGWTDTRGDGEWVVSIRCGEVRGKSLRLFAGAGIVAGSTPEGEAAETRAKLRTMLLACGAIEATS